MLKTSNSSARPETLKLVIDTVNKKVLFAEATKAALDLLCNLLALPVAERRVPNSWIWKFVYQCL